MTVHRSRQVASAWPGLIMTVAAILASACTAAQRPSSATFVPAPSVAEARSLTCRGIALADGPVTLSDGKWAGPPYVEGGASRARVELDPGVIASGDLDGDGDPESAVLVYSSGGGSGRFSDIAVLARRQGRVECLATRMLGDRVQLRSMKIEDGRLIVEVLRPGPGDPACCPRERATFTWRLDGDELRDALPVVTR